MTHRSLTLALLGVVALAFCVAPALAKPGADDGGQGAEHQKKVREHRQDLREKFHEKCDDPANDTVERRCEKARHLGEMTFKARRAAHALMMAINATEHRIERLEAKEARLNASIQSGNLTAENQTKAEHRLEVVQMQLEKARHRLGHLQDRLDHLKEKWADVREHVQARREAWKERHESASPSPTPSA